MWSILIEKLIVTMLGNKFFTFYGDRVLRACLEKSPPLDCILSLFNQFNAAMSYLLTILILHAARIS